ncbi:hypothetical protein BJX61DRAFT_75493 [Aspergillus egyptiacus]|nr:hypothetical protein BJX61DRAFT_75493 [Aspergillus egyptiacus]
MDEYSDPNNVDCMDEENTRSYVHSNRRRIPTHNTGYPLEYAPEPDGRSVGYEPFITAESNDLDIEIYPEIRHISSIRAHLLAIFRVQEYIEGRTQEYESRHDYGSERSSQYLPRTYDGNRAYGENTAPGSRHLQDYQSAASRRHERHTTQSTHPGDNMSGHIQLWPGHPPSIPSQSVLDHRYKVQSPGYFCRGKVFSILWHENDGRGLSGTHISSGPVFQGKYGEPIYSTIRRMVVYRVVNQCSWCFSIGTYSGRGVAKQGVDASKHAAVYLRGTEPIYGRREPRMVKEPLEVAPERYDERLDPMSRLSFAKIYTVEHNVKVLPIGKISSASMTRFLWYAREELSAE